MIKSALKTLLATTVGAATLSLTVATESAHAVRVTYDFEVNIPKGQYQGNFTGKFSYDDTNLLSKGLEYVAPSEGGLQVSFNFLNNTYTEKSDYQFSEFPKVWFRDGALLGLSYLVVPPTANPGFLFVPAESLTPGTDIPFGAGFYLGSTVTNEFGLLYGDLVDDSIKYAKVEGSSQGEPDPNPPGTAVPEPSEIAGTLLALGLLGFGLKMRKRLTAVQSE